MEGAPALLLAVCGTVEILPPEEPHAGVQTTRPAAYV